MRFFTLLVLFSSGCVTVSGTNDDVSIQDPDTAQFIKVLNERPGTKSIKVLDRNIAIEVFELQDGRKVVVERDLTMIEDEMD